MADYKGNTCPVCKQKFKEADDIVVCPDCGTPYHRECWKKVGVCVHQADHAAGFEWTPDNVISDRPDDIVCPNCGTHNPLGAKYCNHCGVSLPDHPDNVQYQQDHPAPGGNGPVYANGSYQAGGAPQYRQAPRQEQAPDQDFFSAGSMGPDGFTCKEEKRHTHHPLRTAATGGTSWAAVFIYLGVYIAAGVLGSFLMGPDLNAVIRFLTM